MTFLRSERAGQVVYLRSEGLLFKQIAREMGLSLSYVSELYRDPEGKEADRRRDRMRGTCLDCGEQTSYHSKATTPKRCARCERIRRAFDVPDHGTHARYAGRGCRCDSCTAANTRYCRSMRERKRAAMKERDEIEGARLAS